VGGRFSTVNSGSALKRPIRSPRSTGIIIVIFSWLFFGFLILNPSPEAMIRKNGQKVDHECGIEEYLDISLELIGTLDPPVHNLQVLNLHCEIQSSTPAGFPRSRVLFAGGFVSQIFELAGSNLQSSDCIRN
jgi:hypothetical protein